MPRDRLTITIDDRVLAEVRARGDNESGRISRDLARYYEALREARARLRELLSEQEVGAILDNLNGVALLDEFSVRLIWANVDDGIRLAGLAKKWTVDGPALVAMLRGLSYLESCALADAADRWWTRTGNGEAPAIAEALL